MRGLGFAAIAGGVLRIADTFTTHMLSQQTLAVLYLLTDILLLAGIAGVWLARRGRLGLAGASGLAVFVLGILMIRAAAVGLGQYQTGATVALLGLALYAAQTMLPGWSWAAAAWLTAPAAGLLGSFGVAPAATILAAGVLFGLGFVAAGGEIAYTRAA